MRRACCRAACKPGWVVQKGAVCRAGPSVPSLVPLLMLLPPSTRVDGASLSPGRACISVTVTGGQCTSLRGPLPLQRRLPGAVPAHLPRSGGAAQEPVCQPHELAGGRRHRCGPGLGAPGPAHCAPSGSCVGRLVSARHMVARLAASLLPSWVGTACCCCLPARIPKPAAATACAHLHVPAPCCQPPRRHAHQAGGV